MAKKFYPRPSLRRARLFGFEGGMNTSYDGDMLPFRYAKSTYNMRFSKGALINGMGIEQFAELGQNVRGIFLFRRFDEDAGVRDDKLLFFCESGAVYYRALAGGAINRLYDVVLRGKPCCVNYRLFSCDVVLICSERDNMLVWDGVNAPYYIANSPYISSLDVHNERVFATTDGDRSAVWFSQDLDPTNWEIGLDAGGFIQLIDERGGCNKVVSYLSHLYVFRENGISRILAYGPQEEFSVSHLFVAGSKIYPDTVCLCGDRIMFLCEDGIYAFNGADTYKISGCFEGCFGTNAYAYGAFLDGFYYCALRMDFLDGECVGCEQGSYKNNALLRYSLASKSWDIMRGVDIACLFGVQDDAVMLCSVYGRQGVACLNMLGSAFSEPLVKAWITPKTDFGVDKKKMIRQLFVRSEHDVFVEIVTENQHRRFFVKGSDRIFVIRTVMRCDVAEFRIISEQDVRVLSVSVVFSS